MTTPFNVGIVSTGMIAGVIADALGKASKARLAAVSSRTLANAEAFAAKYPGAVPVEGADALIAMAGVDALYVACPTVAKEAIALAAIAAGKHVLVDKPFVSLDSVRRMTEAAAAKGVLFMDATHFVHHPRTAAIQAALAAKIGAPRSLHTSFYFPFDDRENIRFRPEVEPLTGLGDMGWYPMRAIVEYLRPAGAVSEAAVSVQRDEVTTGIVRASGMLAFDSGEVSTFDVGYTTDTCLMDLQLLGTTGVIGMDDFVLDWNNSFPFDNPGIPAGYTHRHGMANRNEISFHPVPSPTPAQVLMLDHFAELATSTDTAAWAHHATQSLKTQQYLDAVWAKV
jgi:predicted dehydrogenase